MSYFKAGFPISDEWFDGGCVISCFLQGLFRCIYIKLSETHKILRILVVVSVNEFDI